MRLFLIFTALYGGLGVILGALGAHGLNERLAAGGTLDAWRTASSYQLFMALALFALALLVEMKGTSRLLAATGSCWIAGTALFSGSIYWLCLDGPGWLGPITPLGGLLLIVGWFLLFFYALTRLKCSLD